MVFSEFDASLHQAYLYHKHGMAVAASDAFLHMSGYNKAELLGLDILHIVNDLLRINVKLSKVEQVITEQSYFIFNKEMDFREVKLKLLPSVEGQAYYLVFDQQPFLKMNNALNTTHHFISDNLSCMALYNAEDFTLLKASKEYERNIFNRYNKIDIIGRRVHEFYIGWQDSIAKKNWEEAIITRKTVFNMEHENINPTTGDIEYFDASITPIVDCDKVKFLAICLNNVTDRVNLRKENRDKALLIEKQKLLLETVIQNQKDTLFIIDNKENIVLNNKKGKIGFNERLGTLKELYEAAEYYDEAGNKLNFERMPGYRLINGESLNDFKLTLKIGDFIKYLNLNGTPIFDDTGVLEYAFMFGTDITELIQSRQMIVNQNKQLEAIMESMPDAIFIFDKQNNLIMSNKAAQDYFDAIPKTLSEAFGTVRYYERNGREIPMDETPAFQMQKGINVYDRIIVMKIDDNSKIMSINATPMFDEAGNYKMGIVSCRDITEYMQKEDTISAQQQALLIAEKKEKENLEKLIAMKDEFLSLISHEFKTPLTVINSALQAMEFLYKDQLTDNVVKYLDRIKQNTYRQVRLVNNLLDITGANAGHIKLNLENRDIVFITQMLVETVSTYANQKGVKISFNCKCKQKIMAIDEEKYERILLNLLSNAIKFTPRDKAITVEIICKKEKVILKVIDEGIGIPKEKHDMIFERFGQADSSYTRQAEGSGIGLSLVKLMVQAMGGNVYLESEPGLGSSFIVELSADKAAEEPDAVQAKQLIDSRLIQSIAIEFSDIYF